MTLTCHPGSDHQIAVISTGAGHARDIMVMLADAHALIDGFADGTAGTAARAAATAALADAGSPCTLTTLAGAPGQTVTWLHIARRNAFAGLPRT